MGNVKQINLKNRTYYFYNDQIKRLTFITLVMWLLKQLLIVTILTV